MTDGEWRAAGCPPLGSKSYDDAAAALQPSQGPAGQEVYESTCFMVKVGDHHFYAGDRDWSEHPSFGKKYSKLRVSDAVASEESERHPDRHIRAVKVRQVYYVEETS